MSIMLNFATFLFVKAFPILLETQDVHGSLMLHGMGCVGNWEKNIFYIFAIVIKLIILCVVGALFVLFVMNETSGMSLDDEDDADDCNNDDEMVEKGDVFQKRCD